MKKKLLVAGIVVTILAALAVAGFAFAQAPTPNTPFGPGMMGGRGGMMGVSNTGEGYGPMHEVMQEAMAEALGISEEELEERHAAGDTAWTIAQEKGLTQEEFVTLMTEARTKAFTKLVEDGVLTQEQADWMQQRMGTRLQNGSGYGTGSCMGGGYSGGRRGPGRWNTQP